VIYGDNIEEETQTQVYSSLGFQNGKKKKLGYFSQKFVAGNSNLNSNL